MDRYAYVNNNPMRFTDPSGHWFETAVDIAFIAYDIHDISSNGLNWENGLSLAADVASAALPIVTGGGLAVRAIAHADDIVNAVSAVDKAVDVAETADNLADIYKSAVKNPRSKVAVLGEWVENGIQSYEKVGEKFKNTYMYLENYGEFVNKYGREAFWEYVNKPYMQKEIIEKGKTVLLNTSFDTILKMDPEKRFLRREIDELINAGYSVFNDRMLIPRGR